MSLLRPLVTGNARPTAPVAAALILIVLLAGIAEEAMEEIVRCRAAAAEELGEVVALRLHLGPDVHDRRRHRLRDVPEGVGAQRAGNGRAVGRRYVDRLR